MYTDSLSKIFLACLTALVLTACGGSGGGGGGCGGTILAPSGDADCTEAASGNVDLSIIFDAADTDNILAGNERATLEVKATENGTSGELVVRFSTTAGTLVESSSSTVSGVAKVDIIGDGSGTAATVTATVTLSDGTELSDEIIVQMSSESSSDISSIELSIIFDAANEDNILTSNERATLEVKATEDGASGELVVRFSSDSGNFADTSAATRDGIATVDIFGDGSGTPATVTATVTLSDGTELSDVVVVQMSSESSSDISSIELSIIFDAANEDNILAGNERATLEVKATENGTSGELVVRFSSDSDNFADTSAATRDGIATVDIFGDGSGTAATVIAAITLSDGTEISTQIIVQMAEAESSIELSIIFNDDTSGDDILAGNERATLQAIANEEGATGELVVVFSTTGGTLVDNSAVTVNGTATVDIIGAGTGTPATVTGQITLSDGTTITEELTVQMSADKPEIFVVVRDINGIEVTQFDSNVELTAEATVIDWDGGPLEGDDTELAVSFTLGAFADVTVVSALTAFEACPVVGIKAKTDCAFVTFKSSTTQGTGDVIATITINNIILQATINVENTGVIVGVPDVIPDGIPDQESFTITRRVGATDAAQSARVALEGDEFNNIEAIIRVDLGDFQQNPVPDDTIVEFRTELGAIAQSCEIVNGFCEVSFVSGEPRSPTNAGVSFRNLDDDNCPSNYIEDEQVAADSGGEVLTDYRVADVLRVRHDGTGIVLTEGSSYTINSSGINCSSCVTGQALQITYRRLWLDEENDSSTVHLLLTPGVATEPFLDTKGIPCLATSRGNLEEITGNIEPTASTTVTGISTRFLTELVVGDLIKVGNEVQTVSSIASDTSLVVTSAFSSSGNDTSPERIAAPAYLGGMGQPFGARSSILAWTQGEESFDDINGNGEYDFGETFNDLPEAFLDKNEDGVLGDSNGDSAVAGTLGPYRDAGLGTNAPANSEVRLKNNPFCYGPASVVGKSGDGNDSTESSKYCYQDGGEEEDFIDSNENGVMDVGNGIYNGSRCLNPTQNDTTVCTTDLIDVRRTVLVSLAGSTARTSFRALGSNGLGGTFGGGEIIQGIENRSGITIEDAAGAPTSWTAIAAPNPNAAGTITPTLLSNNLAGFPLGGARIDTTVLDAAGSPGSIDKDEEVSLFRITNPFSRTQAIYEVSFDFDVGSDGTNRTGAIDLFIGGVLQIDNCEGSAAIPIQPLTCTVSGLNGSETGDLLFVVGEAPGANFRVNGTIHNVQITATTTGTDGEFRSTELLVSNSTAVTNLTQFSLSEDPKSNSTVFPGVSERAAPSAVVPDIFTTQTSGLFWFTDRFNGQMPDGTTVKLESAATGCQLTSAGGRTVTGDTSAVFTVGADIDFALSFSVAQGGGGAGAIFATVTTPIGNQTSDSISCDLLI
jgi:hypothetical protein